MRRHPDGRRAAVRLAAAMLAVALSAPQAAGGGRYEATSHRRFDDVDHWVSVFDDPGRDEWQKPDAVVAALGLAPGDRVADLGAGTGYFASRLSRAVGAAGSVFAVEVEPKLVEYLRQRAERETLANLIPILGSASNPRLPRSALDVVLIVDTFHHLDERDRYLRDLAATLKPGGRVAVVDWRKGDLPVGPGDDHKLAREQVVEEMEAVGYRLLSERTELPYQYVLVFGEYSTTEESP